MLDLDDPRCLRVEVAGGKAAGLSRARAAGLPALQGAVLPTSVATQSLQAGASALSGGGSGAARRAVMAERFPATVGEQLRAAVTRFDGDVIVRSSANVESDGEWAGAFSSFSEIGVDDVGTAVRGCWASAFGVDVLERSERTGHETGELAMAVLIQPRIEPRVSGLARVRKHTVEIEVVRGAPAALMSGWAHGQRVTVDAQSVVHCPPGALLTDREAGEVAALLRMTLQQLGHSVIEWAIAGDDLVLLQSIAAPPPATSHQPNQARLSTLDHRHADRVARLAVAFPGGLSEELILPWALGILDLTQLVDEPGQDPGDLDTEFAHNEARALAQQVWGGHPDVVAERCRSLLRALRSDTPEVALDALDGINAPDVDRGRALVNHIRRAGSAAVAEGRLRSPEDIFGCELAEVVRGTGQRQQSWAGARRWEPFLAAVAQTRGTTIAATPASPGVGAGQVRVVATLDEVPTVRRPRSVLVAPLPIPGLSPLLWDAAGLVTVGGSAGAHLIEVARSLGVPAVVSCGELPPMPEVDGLLAAVDGDAGAVSLHQPLP